MSYPELIHTYRTELQRYTPEQLSCIPAPGVWSLCQLYDHLILTTLEYLHQVEQCTLAAEEQPTGKSEAGEQLFGLGEFPPVKIRLPEGPSNTPCNTHSKEDLERGLDDVLQSMSAWEKRIGAIPHNRKVKHGGFGWLNAGEWFELAGMHFRHHLRQLREIEGMLGIHAEG
ncbi:DinB family protein [Paenibacillus sp. S-38]|uniref:DinB family protein n=1 Tax=Paenibacillus sp. S-38 TaxID=3416710 RepID=UPI003CF76F4F